MLLQAEFLAIALVLVYVGGDGALPRCDAVYLSTSIAWKDFWSYLPMGGIVALLMVAEMSLIPGGSYYGVFESDVPQTGCATGNVQAVARLPVLLNTPILSNWLPSSF